MSHKKTYPITITLVALLAGFSTILACLRLFIPRTSSNICSLQAGEYVQIAHSQNISWYPLNEKTLLDAKHLQKPILLVMGTMASTAARIADHTIFNSRDVIDKLKQNYVCVKIDLSLHPEWGTVYLPLTRANIHFDQSFQVWILKPNGEPFNCILSNNTGTYISPTGFSNALISITKEFSKIKNQHTKTTTLETLQTQDLINLYCSKPGGMPNFEHRGMQIESYIDSKHGGLPINTSQELDIYGWLLLAQMGKIRTLQRSIDPVLCSPMVDWLEGGFYHRSNDLNLTQIEFDQLATQNAEMARLLAILWCLTKNPFYYQLATQTLNGLLSNFCSKNLFYAYRMGDETTQSRSKSSSFSPRVLKSRFTHHEYQWLQKHLGLKCTTNPQMLPHVPNPKMFFKNSHSYHNYLNTLKSLRNQKPTYGGYGLCYINGTVIARAIEAARLLGDQNKIKQLIEIFTCYKNTFRSEQGDLLACISGKSTDSLYLGDPLAYTDAALQYYLVTGDKAILHDGYVVLQKILSSHISKDSNTLLHVLNPIPYYNYPLTPIPNILDTDTESLISKAIRVTFAYGCIFELLECECPNITHKCQMLPKTFSLISKHTNMIEDCKHHINSFYCVTYMIDKKHCTYVIDRDPINKANKLARLQPLQLVIPIVPQLKSKSGKRIPGVYNMIPGKPNSFL